MSSKTNLVSDLGKHIDKLRRERNLSFQEMADLCEMDKAQVYKICTKGVDLRVSSLVKIAIGLQIQPSQVLDYE